MTERKNKKVHKVLIIALVVVTLAAVSVSVWAVWFRPAAVNTDYAPKQVDKGAEHIGEEEDNGDKLTNPEGGGAVSLTYSKEVTLDLSTKEAAVLFQNPSRSNQDMALQLVIDGKVIAQSERLPVGYKLSALKNVDTAKLSAGTYEGKFLVLYYNTETSEKAIVNTEIPVTITVR